MYRMQEISRVRDAHWSTYKRIVINPQPVTRSAALALGNTEELEGATPLFDGGRFEEGGDDGNRFSSRVFSDKSRHRHAVDEEFCF